MKAGNFLTTTFILFAPFFLTAQDTDTLSKQEKAYELGLKAQIHIERGESDQAIRILEDCLALDPKNLIYPYQIALAHFEAKDFEKAILLLERLTGHPNNIPLIYQLLGNAYDMNQDYEKAIGAYKRGLEKFPDSGMLYVELGVVELNNENINNAVNYWLNGIEKEPNYSSNYYWLAQYFAGTKEKIWAILFGEIFLNLEFNTARSAEISNLVWSTYQRSLVIKGEKEVEIKFTELTLKDPSQEQYPFNMNYELTMTMAFTLQLDKPKTSIDLPLLSTTREEFVRLWFKLDHHDTYPFGLFEYQNKLRKKGLLEAYHYLLLGKAQPEVFDSWKVENESDLFKLIKWIEKNPFIPDEYASLFEYNMVP